MTEYILYLLVGKLLIYLLMEAVTWKVKLFRCDLCLGVYIYTFLSWGTGITIFSDVIQSHTLLMGLITGGVSSFIMHLLSLGWREKYMVITIE